MRLIPTEIVLHILKALDNEEDLVQCIYVCKQWSYHALEQLWYRPNITRSPRCLSFFTTLQLTHHTFPYTTFIRRINLAPLASLVNDSHITKLAKCQRLERLTLANCFYLTDVGLCSLIDVKTGIGPELISLDLTDVLNVTDKTLLKVAICCPRLQGLNLSMSRPHFDITDVGVVALAQQCPELKRIKLNNCVTITEKSSIALALNCPHLVEVDLMNCGVTDRTLHALFDHCRDLRELRLNQCDAAESLLTDRVLIQSALASQPNYYEQLRLVDFTGVSSIVDHSLAILVEAAPRIRSLVLNKCFKVTDEGVLSVCQLGKFLHYLHLGHCSQLTDRSITRLAAECSRIRYLDLACCIDITDKSVVELAKHLTKLKRIGLVKCSNITDAAIQALSVHSINIERVHLSYCVKLTAPAIARLLHRCKYLNHLSLTHVPAFLREDYQQFCRSAPVEFTELQRQTFCVYSAYKYLEELARKKQSDVSRFLLRVRCWEYRQLNVIHRASRPSRPDKARRLGYKAKQGYVIYRIRVRRGGRKRPVPKGATYGKPVNEGVSQLKYQRSLRSTAEERVGRKCRNLRVLNSYWINQDATYKYFEVILVDPSHKAIRNDARINWIVNPVHKRREARGLTAVGKKSRGHQKGHRFNNTKGSGRRATWKRRNTLSLRRYR
ncbi:hypothetical protein G6F46_009637 [Rhizopus delemar]|uniref:Ribosomal protein L15 n=2 Tax=Rhizopus TaxID=4842 RepID=A0A9P6YUL5_9FUNG|nr:hypothetical protein G6F43_008486 [Rhizopus delemar]KAG1537445.1 hypothetical protein G6F51_010371 [Rhizopus arrhizus]KAG1450927.1 hypothetical protein G6F55_009442 [Rhizopus delemar]KAG1499808.1 hypothetical protein G6F54_004151 [Rhizopus delemar]KAG1505937.1 hypothetical protein G6F53_010052 [Rhizopus delemar]